MLVRAGAREDAVSEHTVDNQRANAELVRIRWRQRVLALPGGPEWLRARLAEARGNLCRALAPPALADPPEEISTPPASERSRCGVGKQKTLDG